MARKGNLLYNGDFETGTTVGWEEGPFGKPDEFIFGCLDIAPYRGNYHGYLGVEVENGVGFYAYDKVCSFEECEAYLYIIYINKQSGDYANLVLYGLDDKGNLIEDFIIGRVEQTNVWERCQAILRGFGDITHFKVGLKVKGKDGDGIYYIDEAKLFPLKSVKGHVLAQHYDYGYVSESFKRVVPLACIGECRLVSSVMTLMTSGTDPTLDITITISYFGIPAVARTFSHKQITGNEIDEIKVDLPEVSYIEVNYNIGGTNPSFYLIHDIRLIPSPSGSVESGAVL